MYKFTDYPYLLETKPEVVKDRIFAAYIEHKANMPKVFKALGITAFSYYKYVRILGLKNRLIALREALHPGTKFAGRHYADDKPAPKAEPAISSGPASIEDSGVWGP